MGGIDIASLGPPGLPVALGLAAIGGAGAVEGVPRPFAGTGDEEGDSVAGIRVSFSPEALARSRGLADEAAEAKDEETETGELTKEEQQEVQELKQRDAEVRRHEQAHLAAGGRYVRGGANFEYTRGPDGRQYATGGEVSIDVSPARTPEATITKAQVVRRAALAPAQPSAQDRGVAASASQMESKARSEVAKQRIEEAREANEEGSPFAAGVGGDAPLAPEEPPALDGTDLGPPGTKTLDLRA